MRSEMVEMGVRDETAIHRVMGVEPPAELGEVEAVAVLDVPGHGANLAGAPEDQTDWRKKAFLILPRVARMDADSRSCGIFNREWRELARMEEGAR